jgi:mitogen-activated protein kinase 7
MTSLYDMDIVFDPPGSGMFSEVYLYEEQMEADLHAIVSHLSRITSCSFS